MTRPVGIWLVASAAQGADAPYAETYPHIHGLEVPGVVAPDGTKPRYGRRECVACTSAGSAPTGPSRWVLPAHDTAGTARTGIRWWWTCSLCQAAGRADSEANSAGLKTIHLDKACPATATVYYRPEDPDCYVYRVARHQQNHRRFPDLFPAWAGKFNGDKRRSSACPPWCRSTCRTHVFTCEELAGLGAEEASN